MKWVPLLILFAVIALMIAASGLFTRGVRSAPVPQLDRIEAMLCQFRRGNTEIWLGDSSVSGRLEFRDTNEAYLAFEACPKP